MQAETLSKILELYDQTKEVFEIGGIKRTYCESKPILPTKHQVIEFRSLTGLVDYISNNKDGIDISDCIIQVVNHSMVAFSGVIDPVYKNRPLYAVSMCDSLFRPFEFNRWYEHEDFMIKLYSLFQPDDERKLEMFINTVRKAKRVEEQTSEDDSKSIKRSQSRGIDIPGDRDAFVAKLKPFRTFVEVDQPESQFIFRIREKYDNLECALFECDGGAWVNAARENIVSYLRVNLVRHDLPEFIGIPIYA